MFRGLTNTKSSIHRATKLFLTVLPFVCISALAQIHLDATSTQTGPAGSTSLTWSHTLGSGSNRMVVCGVTLGYNDAAIAVPLATTPSMTFNGLAMTASIQAPTHAESSTAKIFSQIFYIDA